MCSWHTNSHAEGETPGSTCQCQRQWCWSRGQVEGKLPGPLLQDKLCPGAAQALPTLAGPPATDRHSDSGPRSEEPERPLDVPLGDGKAFTEDVLAMTNCIWVALQLTALIHFPIHFKAWINLQSRIYLAFQTITTQSSTMTSGHFDQEESYQPPPLIPAQHVCSRVFPTMDMGLGWSIQNLQLSVSHDEPQDVHAMRGHLRVRPHSRAVSSLLQCPLREPSRDASHTASFSLWLQGMQTLEGVFIWRWDVQPIKSTYQFVFQSTDLLCHPLSTF